MSYAEVEANVSARFPLSTANKVETPVNTRSSWTETSYLDYFTPRPLHSETRERKLSLKSVGDQRVTSVSSESLNPFLENIAYQSMDSFAKKTAIGQVEETAYP